MVQTSLKGGFHGTLGTPSGSATVAHKTTLSPPCLLQHVSFYEGQAAPPC